MIVRHEHRGEIAYCGQQLLLLLRAGMPAAKRRIVQELRAHGGNVSLAAVALGISRSKLSRIVAGDESLRRHTQGREGSRAAAMAARELKAAR